MSERKRQPVTPLEVQSMNWQRKMLPSSGSARILPITLAMKAMSEEFPDRVINIGIAEQNMMGVAAGLAATGFQVFAGSFAPFVSMRALEQFRTFIAYPHLNVKVAGGMGGLSAGNEGVTHQAPEDMAIMRTIPGNVVVYPADNAAVRAVVKPWQSMTDRLTSAWASWLS